MTFIPGTGEIKKTNLTKKDNTSEAKVWGVVNVQELKKPKEEIVPKEETLSDKLKNWILIGAGIGLLFGLFSFLYFNLIFAVPFFPIVAAMAWYTRRWAHKSIGKHDYLS